MKFATRNRATNRLLRDTQVSSQRMNRVGDVRRNRIPLVQPNEMRREPRRQDAQGVLVEFAQYAGRER